MKRCLNGYFLRGIMCVAVWLTALSVWAEPTAPVRLQNSGFEEDETEWSGWSAWGEGDIRSEYYGLVARESQNFLRLWSRSGVYQNFPVKPGEKYRAMALVASAGQDALWGDAFGELKIEWRRRVSDDDDTQAGLPISLKFSCDKVLGRQAIEQDQWQQIVLPVAQVPEGATHGRVLCTIYTSGGDQGGGCALFDDVVIERVR